MNFDLLHGWALDTPRLCADLPGVGGRIKQHPEDFVVQEVPSLTPSGRGEHLYLWIEKRGLDALALVSHIEETLAVPRRDIGMAGMKDALAVTQQYVSVPHAAEAKLSLLDNEHVRVLSVQRHERKLRTGELVGNRFKVRVRGVDPSASSTCQSTVERLAQLGAPNYFGPQRFGHHGSTLQAGCEILHSNKTLSMRLHRLALDSVQSALFNQVLARRLRGCLLRTIMVGDVLWEREDDSLSWCTDVALAMQRFQAGEVVPTGPLFGSKMRQPRGEVLRREHEVFREAELDGRAMLTHRRQMPGGRRPLVVPVHGMNIQFADSDLVASFELPRGAYATVVLRELMGEEPHD